MAEFDFPLVSYYFAVSFDGSNESAIDSQFQEVSGLEVERSIETIEEGGVNNYVHRVPGRLQYPNLILKRGLITTDSDMAKWVRAWFDKDASLAKLGTKKLEVALKDPADGKDVMTWTFMRAYPVKWSISDFNAQNNSIVVESLELAYQSFTIS